MSNHYEMDDLDRALIVKFREAVEATGEGDPLKDYVDDEDFIDAMKLLIQIVDSGAAS